MLTLQCDTILNINQLGMIFFAYQQTLPPIWLGIVSQQGKHLFNDRTVPPLWVALLFIDIFCDL